MKVKRKWAKVRYVFSLWLLVEEAVGLARINASTVGPSCSVEAKALLRLRLRLLRSGDLYDAEAARILLWSSRPSCANPEPLKQTASQFRNRRVLIGSAAYSNDVAVARRMKAGALF